MTIKAVVGGRMPGGERWSNTFHFAGDTMSNPDGQAIADRLREFYDDLKPYMSTSWAADECIVGLVDTTTGQFNASWEVLVGTSSSPALPNDMAVVISWQTAFRGRSYRGRTYTGGHTTTSLGYATGKATVVEPAATSALAAAAGNLLEDQGVNLPRRAQQDRSRRQPDPRRVRQRHVGHPAAPGYRYP